MVMFFKVLYISIHFKPISGETIENVDWSQVNMIDIHIRPWVKLNGLINRKILDQLLTSILYHTLSHPGSTIAKITNYIQPALQPFHIRELLGKSFDANYQWIRCCTILFSTCTYFQKCSAKWGACP